MIYIIERFVNGRWERYCRKFVQGQWYDEPGNCPVMFSRKKNAIAYLKTRNGRGDGFRIIQIKD
jgi:hypothetical protein